MSSADNIIFLLLAIGAVIVICVSLFLLRNYKKWAWIVMIVVVVLYIGWYLYYPTYKEVTHEKRYEQLLAYLEERYPDEQFVIEPEVYEPGYQVGDFDVSYANTNLIGVRLRVLGDQSVIQTGFWTNYGSLTQESLWRTIITGFDMHTLDRKLPHVEKKDYWIEGELTVFAVTIDERPALAFYMYDQGGYSMEPIVEAERGEVVSAEWKHRFFVYIDEAYGKETALVEWQGEKLELDAVKYKGKLVVLE